MGRHNLISCLKGSGRHEEALRVLNETRASLSGAWRAVPPGQKAAEAEQVTLGLIQEVVTSLEQTRRAGERG